MTSKACSMSKPKRGKNLPDQLTVPLSAGRPAPLGGKLGSIQALVERTGGATISEMMLATGWQAHSVRGAISGSLRKSRGIDVISEMKDGERRYRVGGAA